MNVLRKFFIKLKNLRGLKLGLFLGTLALIISSSGVLYVYSQSVAGGSIGGSSLNKGLIAHWTLDADLYEEGTVNLVPYTDYSNRVYNQPYSAACWGGDIATIEYFSNGGYNNLPYKKLTKTVAGTGGCYLGDHVNFVVEDNKTYVISAWIKASRNQNFNGHILNINRASDNAYRLFSSFDVTTEWKRYSWVYSSGTGHAGNYHARHIIYDNADLPLEVYWAGFQVEEKPYATPFVSGTRIDRVVDSTPYSNHGTNYGAMPTTDRHGKTGGAMSFDGVNNYMLMADAVTTDPTSLTVSAWLRKDGHGSTYECALHQATDASIGNTSFWLGLNTADNFVATIGARTGVGWAAGQLTEQAVIGEWNHLLATWDGSVVRVYLNGQFKKQYNLASYSNIATPIRLGASSNGANYQFNGSIDDVRIYNRSFSDDEVATIYGSYQPKTQISSVNSGLIGHWTLSEEDYNSSGNQVIDKTPYSNHGTNYDATFTTDRHGKIGGAMSFNGSTNTVDINTSTYPVSWSDNFSLSSWIYIPSSVSWTTTYISNIISRGSYTGSHGLTRSTTNNTIRAWARGSNTSISAMGTITRDKWHHTLMTWDGNTLKLYIDSVLSGSGTNNLEGSPANTAWFIGRARAFSGAAGSWYQGLLNDVRIYNRALSDDEISLLYSSYNPQTGGDTLQSGLILDMPLTSDYTKTETSGSEIMTDRTPYGNDGQNYGAIITAEGASFDGVNDRIVIGPMPIGNEFSMGAWTKVNNPNNSGSGLGGVISNHFHSGLTYGANLYVRNLNGIVVAGGDGAGDRTSRTFYPSATFDEWNHFFTTYKNGEFLVYTNGVLTGSFVKGVMQNDTIWEIGRWANTYNGYYFHGVLSGAKVYNRALSPQEVESLHARGRQ